MNCRCTLALLAAAAAIFIATGCEAAKLETGAAGPGFSGTGVDDKQHSLADYKDAKALVLVFTCNHCPVAVVYQDRLIQLQKDYKDKGVQVVAVCVNDKDGDRLPGMKRRAKEKGFNFPYLYDKTQQSARAYGATCTPHVFLLDKDRKVAYQGAVDGNNNPEGVEHRFLRDAIDAVLVGREVEMPITRQRGCGIKWSKKKKEDK